MFKRILSGLILVLTIAVPARAQDISAGNEAYKRGDYDAALKILWPLAAKGDAEAQNNLGLMYYRGNGIIKDRAEAAAWFRMAAEQGHARAQYNLGLSYHKGDGVPKDLAAALKWFRQAAENGNAMAQNNLAVMYYRGEGVAQNSVEAVKWFQKAADSGHVRARNNLELIRRLQSASIPAASTGSDAGSADGAVKADKPSDPVQTAGETGSQPVARARGYLVQVGSFRSEGAASKEADRLNRLHEQVLAEMKVAPARADLDGKGVYFRLRAGPFENRAAASGFCRKLSARKQPSLVVPPGK